MTAVSDNTATTLRADARARLRHTQAVLGHARALEQSAARSRRDAIREARASGLSYQEIAATLGMSRQAVHLLAA